MFHKFITKTNKTVILKNTYMIYGIMFLFSTFHDPDMLKNITNVSRMTKRQL